MIRYLVSPHTIQTYSYTFIPLIIPTKTFNAAVTLTGFFLLISDHHLGDIMASIFECHFSAAKSFLN